MQTNNQLSKYKFWVALFCWIEKSWVRSPFWQKNRHGWCYILLFGEIIFE